MQPLNLGIDLCLRYREVRRSCLVDSFANFDGGKGAQLGEVARQLRLLSGLYGIRPLEARQICKDKS